MEYTWQFKTAKDVLESHIGGALILTKYVTWMADYIDKTWRVLKNVAKRPVQVCLHSCIRRFLIK